MTGLVEGNVGMTPLGQGDAISQAALIRAFPVLMHRKRERQRKDERR